MLLATFSCVCLPPPFPHTGKTIMTFSAGRFYSSLLLIMAVPLASGRQCTSTADCRDNFEDCTWSGGTTCHSNKKCYTWRSPSSECTGKPNGHTIRDVGGDRWYCWAGAINRECTKLKSGASTMATTAAPLATSGAPAAWRATLSRLVARRRIGSALNGLVPVPSISVAHPHHPHHPRRRLQSPATL